MSSLQKVNLGTPPTAVDGDTSRGANTKMNANVDVLNTQAILTSSAALITAAQALTVAHVGKRVNISLAAAGTINLPVASTCAADNVIHLRNVGATLVTLAITVGSGDTASLTTLAAGESAIMDTDGVHAWTCAMRGRSNSANETVAGILTLSGTNKRIMGDFNGTAGTGTVFANNVPTGSTFVGAVPSGTGTLAGFIGWDNAYASWAGTYYNTASAVGTVATSGNPLTFVLNGVEYARLYAGYWAFGIVNAQFLFNGNSPTDGVAVGSDHSVYIQNKVQAGLWVSKQGSAAGTYSADLINFYYNASKLGSISFNGTTNGVLYNTGSDYRLKDGLVPIADDDALDSLRKSQMYKGYFKSDPTKTLQDVLLAHEIAEIVPEAVSGSKDATEWAPVFREGYDPFNVKPDDAADVEEVPVIQQVDHSKLVVRLWAINKALLNKLDLQDARLSALEAILK